MGCAAPAVAPDAPQSRVEPFRRTPNCRSAPRCHAVDGSGVDGCTLRYRMSARAIARRGSSLLFLNETAVRAGHISVTRRLDTPRQDTSVPFRPRNAALGAALSLSGMVLGGLLVGSLVGAHWDCNPHAAIVGLFVGILAGFYSLARAMWTQE